MLTPMKLHASCSSCGRLRRGWQGQRGWEHPFLFCPMQHDIRHWYVMSTGGYWRYCRKWKRRRKNSRMNFLKAHT